MDDSFPERQSLATDASAGIGERRSALNDYGSAVIEVLGIRGCRLISLWGLLFSGFFVDFAQICTIRSTMDRLYAGERCA